MTVVEKAAYLKGLVEGLGVEPDSRDGKLWAALTDVLSDMAREIEDLQASNADFADALDDISEDLTYLEELTCDLDMPEDPEFSDFGGCGGCGGSCASCGGCCGCGDDEEEEDDDDDEDEDEDEDDEECEYDGFIYEVTCPSCGEEIAFDEETLNEGSIVCPKCGEELEFDMSEEEEDD